MERRSPRVVAVSSVHLSRLRVAGLFGGASQPAAGGGLFGGAAQPAAGGGGLFGASQPAAGGGLFGASQPAAGGGLFGGASQPAAGGGGLFGASQPAAGGGLFGGASQPAGGGGLFGGAAQPGAGLFAGAGQPGNSLALAQPHGSFLSTTNGQPVRHYTQWGELTPQSQQQLKQLEAMIIASREDSKLLDGVERLAEYQPVKKGTGKKGEAAARPSPGTTTNGKLTKGEIQRRELERAAKATGNRLKLLETQLWSDNDRLSGLTEAVVECLRDTEHAQARLQRLKDAHAADELARSHALAHPNQPPPPAAAPVYLPAPQRPSPYLQKTVEKLYATAEGFERGTLEMEHNLRTTGRVLGAGAGGGGQGMEALTAALHGHATSFPAIGTGGGEDGMEKFDGGVAALKALRASRTGGPAEHRAAVEAARRYFNKVGGDLAKLHERVSRAKSAHLAKLREKGDHRDPFAEAEKEEEEARRLAELAEQPQPAMALPAPGMYGQPGVPGQQLALPAPGAAGGLSLTTPGGTSLFGAPGAGGGLFGAAPAPGAGRRSVRRSLLAGDWRRSVWRPRGDDAGCGWWGSLRRISTGCGWGSVWRCVAAGGGWRSVRRPGGVHSRVRRRALRRGCHTGCARVRRALRRTRGVNPGERRRSVRCVSARRGWGTLRRRVSASCRRWHVRRVSARGWRWHVRCVAAGAGCGRGTLREPRSGGRAGVRGVAGSRGGRWALRQPGRSRRGWLRRPRDAGVRWSRPRDAGVRWSGSRGGWRGTVWEPRARGGRVQRRVRRGRVWKPGARVKRQALGSKEVTETKLFTSLVV